MKDIKDYLHLYLGCEMMNVFGDRWILTADYYIKWKNENHKAKPILRPLNDMNKEERSRWRLMARSYQSCATTVKYCLDRHLDLFGLIEAGLAIDKTKLKELDISL